VSHTHWDREWYHTAGRFRQRLVALLDAVLERAQGGETFLLDGQSITLLDFLAVRPDREPELRRQLQAGALEAGPWFVLADNLIPSGEAILRNLEAGRRVLGRFGAVPPPVAYCPDTFGHPAVMPAVAAGYGFPVAVVWRGAGGAGHPPTDAFRWLSPDGASVVAHHLPPDGYEYGSALPSSSEAAVNRWRQMRLLFTARNQTGLTLLLNGADHHALQPDIVEAAAALREAAAPDVIVLRSSLTAFGQQLHAIGQSMSLPHVVGELRDSYGYTWTLGGTLGTRAHQKRRNAQLERLLLRDVEPWLALAWLRHPVLRARRPSPSGALTLAQLPALLNVAWQELLETHPHDTLCGCSLDDVARAMEARQDGVRSQGGGLRIAALELALQHDPVQARSRTIAPDAVGPVVIRNRAPYARAGIAELRLVETIGDVVVGPGGADALPVAIGATAGAPPLPGVLVQPLSRRVEHFRRESPQQYPDNDLVRMHRVVAWVPSVPACGLRLLGRGAADATAPTPVRVRERGATIDIRNVSIRITVQDGRVSLEQDGRRLDDVLVVESTSDVGDSYTPALRGAPERLRCVGTQVLHRGPLRAAVRVRWETAVRDVRVDTVLVLDVGSVVLRCDVRGVNRRRDHRLRLVVRTGFADAVTIADAALGPVERVAAVAPATARETVVPTMPMHRWVSQVHDGQHSTLFSDGLAEVESQSGALAITLVRAIGELSRGDLPERPGHAGWPSPTPQAQSLGRFAARLGVMLHADDADARTTTSQAADALLLPLTGETWRDLAVDGALPLADANGESVLVGPELIGNGLEASAITLAQQHDGIMLRAVNLTNAPVPGAWLLPPTGRWLATRCRLDETPIAPAAETESRIDFLAAPHEIVTLLVTVVS
jgi:alpha-mannosidase